MVTSSPKMRKEKPEGTIRLVYDEDAWGRPLTVSRPLCHDWEYIKAAHAKGTSAWKVYRLVSWEDVTDPEAIRHLQLERLLEGLG